MVGLTWADTIGLIALAVIVGFGGITFKVTFGKGRWLLRSRRKDDNGDDG